MRFHLQLTVDTTIAIFYFQKIFQLTSFLKWQFFFFLFLPKVWIHERVLESGQQEVRVHYVGWSDSFNEWQPVAEVVDKPDEHKYADPLTLAKSQLKIQIKESLNLSKLRNTENFFTDDKWWLRIRNEHGDFAFVVEDTHPWSCVFLSQMQPPSRSRCVTIWR